MDNSEPEETPIETPRGSKRRRNSDEWEKNKRKRARNSKEARLPAHIACKHANTIWCHANLLSRAEIRAFHDLLYAHDTAAKQDTFLLNYHVPQTPKHRRPRCEEARKRTTIQYTIRKKDGNQVPVCAATFRSITGIGEKRISNLCASFMETGEARGEKRGGSRRTVFQVEVEQSIKDHISKLVVVSSHYGRGPLSLVSLCTRNQYLISCALNSSSRRMCISFTPCYAATQHPTTVSDGDAFKSQRMEDLTADKLSYFVHFI